MLLKGMSFFGYPRGYGYQNMQVWLIDGLVAGAVAPITFYVALTFNTSLITRAFDMRVPDAGL